MSSQIEARKEIKELTEAINILASIHKDDAVKKSDLLIKELNNLELKFHRKILQLTPIAQKKKAPALKQPEKPVLESKK